MRKNRKYIVSIALLMILKTNGFLPESVVNKVTEGYMSDEKGTVIRIIDNYAKKHGGGYK